MNDTAMPSGRQLSIVIPCMGRKSDLMETLSSLNPEGAKVIVVDYSCPERCGEAVEANYPDVHVVRVVGQAHFDISHARNAGLEAVTTDWVLFLDADIIPSQGFVSSLFEEIDSGSFYLFRRFRNEGSTGSMVALTETVRKLGGYDRRFVGYGGEDVDMFERLLISGVEPRFITDEPERVLMQTPSERVTNFEEKSITKAISVSRIYGNVKRDIMALEKRTLTGEELDQIRARAEKSVELALSRGRRSVQLTIGLKNSTDRYFPQLRRRAPSVRRRLSYVFDISS